MSKQIRYSLIIALGCAVFAQNSISAGEESARSQKTSNQEVLERKRRIEYGVLAVSIAVASVGSYLFLQFLENNPDVAEKLRAVFH